MKTQETLLHKSLIIIFLFYLLFSNHLLYGQNIGIRERVIFYNTENLFDTSDDSLINDEQFLPEGDKHWNLSRLYKKLNRISQVILAAGEGRLPLIIGLCEIENNYVLELLLQKTPLGKLGYNYIHQDSKDRRGIDVAFIYNKNEFSPLSYNAIKITSSENKDLRTRDILHIKGIAHSDTFHFFINHWPSKFGGAIETKSSRAAAAISLRNQTDSLLNQNSLNKIIIMGDFNDSPFDESILNFLGASPLINPVLPTNIYNMSYSLAEKGEGTNKHQSEWVMLDQIMISGSLLNEIETTKGIPFFSIFSPPFLLEKDKTNLGVKPFRTYIGYKYNNGFSDHLPVTLDLFF